MNRHLAIFAISSAATAGFYFASLLTSPEPNVLADQTITVADTTRLYTLIVPRHLTQPSPLVFAFHGTGDTMQSMAEYSQLNRLACEQGFILVYPAATGPHWDTRVASGDSGNTDGDRHVERGNLRSAISYGSAPSGCCRSFAFRNTSTARKSAARTNVARDADRWKSRPYS